MLVQYMLIFDAFVVGFVVYWEWWRKRGKIRVRVKTHLGEKKYWKKPEKDAKTIVMRKARGKRPGWSFTFKKECLYWISRFLGRKAFCLDVINGATEAVEWDLENKTTEQPTWDKQKSKEFIEAEVLRKRGEGLKYAMPGLFWILVILLIVNVLLSILNFQKLGGF